MLGKRLKSLRKVLKITQRELAQKLGVSEMTIRRYEAGKFQPDAETLTKLAHLFNVNLNWLLTGEGEMFINKEGHSGIPSDRANIHPELYNFLALLPEEQQKQLASVFKEVLKTSSALSSGHTSPLQQERQAEGGRIVEEE